MFKRLTGQRKAWEIKLFCVLSISFCFLFLSNGLKAQGAPNGLSVDGLIEQTEQKLKNNKDKNDQNLDYLPNDNRDDSNFLQTPASEQKTSGTILVRSIVVQGASAFSQEQFASCYKPIKGRKVSEGQLVELTNCMTLIYTQAGFSLSRVVLPPQDVANGVLKVKVVEGYIASYQIKGGNGLLFNLDQFFGPILNERPLSQKTLERQLLLISDTPGLSIKDTTIDEKGDLTGAFELVVHVDTWHVWLQSELDNRGTDPVGPLQSYQTVYLNSVFGQGESIGFSYSSIADSADELNFGRVSLDLPLNGSGLRLFGALSASDTRPSDERKLDDTSYKSLRGNLDLNWVLGRQRDLSFWLGAGIWGHTNVRENQFGRFVRDEVRGLAVSTSLLFEDPWRGETFVYGSLRKGLDVAGASRKGDQNLSRFDGDGEFEKFNVNFVRNQNFDDHWSFQVEGALQVASEGLLSIEEFYLGGSRFGRGFESGILSGDSGFGASFELQYYRDLELGWLNGAQLYGFADVGGIIDDGNEVANGALISSAGVGARLYFDYGFEAEFEVAFPLEDADLPDVNSSEFFFKVGRSIKLNELSLSALWESSPFSQRN